ncbi:ankyrin repeat family protein [Orientia tsutsugamushi str. Kato PP]|uniref:Ankyrin repeat-containing protein 09 n=1 Tax=Orientia tsutsugamushi TaxID=784 RepID=A0A2U3R334_ORITS|nr:ankyrin repeat domain-containing protein [Orientia tsutsugamushi]KJV54132.1 ankyrin repeat family protein [Orientia tsutsugamushi str. Kato PP]SPR07635.1 ankyrin repeat-containing protein 09 [Orientia tsutsugamushi]
MMHNTPLYADANIRSFEDIKHKINEQNINSCYGLVGNTILHIAVKYGHIEIIKYLLTIPGININAQQSKATLYSPLDLAAITHNYKIVALLTHHKADANKRNLLGETPLHTAVTNDVEYNEYNAKIIKCLLKHGADPNIQDIYGQTALHSAVIKNNKIATYLLTSTPRVNMNIEDDNHHIPLYYAIRGGNTIILKILLDYYHNINVPCINYDSNNHTMLHIAAIFGKTDIADILLDNGADINSKNSSNNTALSLAINKWNKQPDEYQPIIKLFISHIIQLKHFDKNITLEALEEHNNLINNYPELKQYKQAYEQEIQLMKGIKLDNSSESLFDVLKDKNRLAESINNSELVDKYNQFRLLQKYINKCIKEATARDEYIKNASDAQIIENLHKYLDNTSTTSQVFWNKLPQELKQEVLWKLSNAELKTLQPTNDKEVLKELSNAELKTLQPTPQPTYDEVGAEAELSEAYAIYEAELSAYAARYEDE